MEHSCEGTVSKLRFYENCDDYSPFINFHEWLKESKSNKFWDAFLQRLLTLSSKFNYLSIIIPRSTSFRFSGRASHCCINYCNKVIEPLNPFVPSEPFLYQKKLTFDRININEWYMILPWKCLFNLLGQLFKITLARCMSKVWHPRRQMTVTTHNTR